MLLGLVLVGYGLGAFAFRRLDHERFYRLVLVLVIVHRCGQRGGRAGVGPKSRLRSTAYG